MDLKDAVKERQEKNAVRADMNQNPQFHVVLDLDGTTPPITVVSGDAEREYYEALNNRCKKTTDFRRDYRLPDKPRQSIPSACKKQIKKSCPCDRNCQKKFWTKRFPVWRIMRKYRWRDDLPNDLVSGLTVGVMQLPQGMAYALLAELPPVVGLYMAFFPVLIYFLLGTSKHVSMGTVALCSLLTGSVISRFYNPKLAADILGEELTNTLTYNATSEATDPNDPIEIELPDEVKISIATSVCLLVGVVQLAMGMFRMGFITTYMSDAMIGGFTTGAAVHVGTSQIKYIFGLHIARSDGIFQIIKTFALIIHHIKETNIPTMIMSAVCIVILYIVKEQINSRFKSKMKFPVPIELLVVVGGTLLSHYLNFHERYHMKIVGKVPAGMPEPSFPSLPSASVYTADVFIIAVVAFSQCVGLAAIMAKKHGYSYDANQELIAYGAGNIFGSFFSCFPYAASVSRSSVQESAGGRTQLASVFSAVLVLIVIVSLGPLFESLPICVLAAIIVVALRSLLLQVLELPKIFRISVYDFFIWVVTFLSVVILHVDYGILIGMLFSFFTVVIRSQRTSAENLEKINTFHVYENSSIYRQTQGVSGVKVIGYNSPLYYANASLFVKQVYTVSGVTPEKRLKVLKKIGKAVTTKARRKSSVGIYPLVTESNEMGSTMNLDYKHDARDDVGFSDGIARQTSRHVTILGGVSEDGVLVNYIILDFSSVTFIDWAGANVLEQIVADYDDVEIKVLLANVNDEVWRVLDKTGFLDTNEKRVYLTVDDAINSINLKTKMKEANGMGTGMGMGVKLKDMSATTKNDSDVPEYLPLKHVSKEGTHIHCSELNKDNECSKHKQKTCLDVGQVNPSFEDIDESEMEQNRTIPKKFRKRSQQEKQSL